MTYSAGARALSLSLARARLLKFMNFLWKRHTHILGSIGTTSAVIIVLQLASSAGKDFQKPTTSGSDFARNDFSGTTVLAQLFHA